MSLEKIKIKCSPSRSTMRKLLAPKLIGINVIILRFLEVLPKNMMLM
jgi:hypothetical protein